MNTGKTKPLENNGGIPKIIKRHGSTTYEVHIHFSSTNKETLEDKMMRIISNDVRLADMRRD